MPQKLGQHFLKNKVKLQRIAKAINPGDSETIIEIGPGHGELTDAIIKQNPNTKIKAIEKDYKLVPILEEKYKDNPNITIVPGDAIKDLEENIEPNYKIVGNIPYYITGRLLRNISELSTLPSLVVFLIQKEVAERILGEEDKYSLLAASINYFGEAKIILNIPKTAFNPPPKVDSSVISITTHKPEIEKETYFNFVKAAFKQPRKLLISNLSIGLKIDKEILEKIFNDLSLNLKMRPQNLSYQTIISLIKKIG